MAKHLGFRVGITADVFHFLQTLIDALPFRSRVHWSGLCHVKPSPFLNTSTLNPCSHNTHMPCRLGNCDCRLSMVLQFDLRQKRKGKKRKKIPEKISKLDNSRRLIMRFCFHIRNIAPVLNSFSSSSVIKIFYLPDPFITQRLQQFNDHLSTHVDTHSHYTLGLYRPVVE